MESSIPPLLDNKNPAEESVFKAAALLREGRRQKGIQAKKVPRVCILDPDGDSVRHLKTSGQATLAPEWPCYHTELYKFELGGTCAGIIGCAVGAPFAVLVAEELFASGCELLISLTSAGQIAPVAKPPYFVIIDRALRDEGTSYHYALPADFSEADPSLVNKAAEAAQESGLTVLRGSSWSTDAPFRETAQAIAAACGKGILVVEMEAAALYAFARAAKKQVLCLAHVTNTMAVAEQDFEKGEAHGAVAALRLLTAILRRLCRPFD